MRRAVVSLFLCAASIPATAQTCTPGYPGACVHPTASVDVTATILPGASIEAYATVGPNVVVDAGVIAQRASLAGRSLGGVNQRFGIHSVLGRNSTIGPDASIADDVVIGRSVHVGSDLDAGTMASVGYGSVLGNRLTLGANAVVGTLVTAADDVTIDGVLARGVQVGSRADISGVVGPGSQIGDDSMVAGRVHKDVVIGDDVVVDAGARIGRSATIGHGAMLGPNVTIGANAVVPDCAWLPGPEVVPNGQTWSGTLFVPGCGAQPQTDMTWLGSFPDAYPNAVDYDASGAQYIAGVSLGDIYVDGVLEISSPYHAYSSVLYKRDASGSIQWVEHAPHNGGQLQYRAIDVLGSDVYVAGNYSGAPTIGGSTLPSTTRPSVFVARISALDGSLQWVATSGGTAPNRFARINDVHVNANGVTVVGDYYGQPAFGSTATLPSIGTSETDVLVAQLSPLGAWAWTAGGGFSGADYATGVDELSSGDLVVSFTSFGNLAPKTPSGIIEMPTPTNALSHHFTLGGVVVLSATGSPLETMYAANNAASAGINGVTTIGNRILAAGDLRADGLVLDGLSIPKPGTQFTDPVVIEWDAAGSAVHAWTAEGRGYPARTGAITSSGDTVYLTYETAIPHLSGPVDVMFGTHVVPLPVTSFSERTHAVVLAALQVNGGGWQWGKSAAAPGADIDYLLTGPDIAVFNALDGPLISSPSPA